MSKQTIVQKHRKSLRDAGFDIIDDHKLYRGWHGWDSAQKPQQPQENKFKLMKWDEIGILLAVAMIAIATLSPYF